MSRGHARDNTRQFSPSLHLRLRWEVPPYTDSGTFRRIVSACERPVVWPFLARLPLARSSCLTAAVQGKRGRQHNKCERVFLPPTGAADCNLRGRSTQEPEDLYARMSRVTPRRLQP